MTEQSWMPETCTLPRTERPGRLEEFATLFARAPGPPSRPRPCLLRLVLDTADEPAATDLIARESVCCPFFTFTIEHTGDGHVILDIAVPTGEEHVLDAMTAAGPS